MCINSVKLRNPKKFRNRIKSENDFESEAFRESNEYLNTDTVDNGPDEHSPAMLENFDHELENIPESSKFIGCSGKKSKKSSASKKTRKNVRYSIGPPEPTGKVAIDKAKLLRKATSRRNKDISITPIRDTQSRKRKDTATTQILSMKNFGENRSVIRKRKIKLRQITFKKQRKLKNNRIKNSSEYSTASQKASKEFVFKSFMSGDSKNTKKSRNKSRSKQRGTIKIKNNLGTIQEEKGKKNKRGKMSNFNSNSNNQKLTKFSQGKKSFLKTKYPKNKGDRRRTI